MRLDSSSEEEKDDDDDDEEEEEETDAALSYGGVVRSIVRNAVKKSLSPSLNLVPRPKIVAKSAGNISDLLDLKGIINSKHTYQHNTAHSTLHKNAYTMLTPYRNRSSRQCKRNHCKRQERLQATVTAKASIASVCQKLHSRNHRVFLLSVLLSVLL